MQVSELLSSVQSRTKITSGKDSVAVNGFNWAQSDFSSCNISVFKKRHTFDLEEDTYEYDLPADFLSLRRKPYVLWNNTLYRLDLGTEEYIVDSDENLSNNLPHFYVIAGFNSTTSRRVMLVGGPTANDDYTCYLFYQVQPTALTETGVTDESRISVVFGSIGDEALINAGCYFVLNDVAQGEESVELLAQKHLNLYYKRRAECISVDSHDPVPIVMPDTLF